MLLVESRNPELRKLVHREQLIQAKFTESSRSGMMRAFSKIIVEEKGGQWSAWFKDLPQVVIGGEWPSDAIRRLLEHVGEANFDAQGIVTVDEGTRDGHLEFWMPLIGFRRIPVPSMN